MHQRKFTKSQFKDRIVSLVHYTVYARKEWGTESAGYVTQVEMLKHIASICRKQHPNIRLIKARLIERIA